VVLRALSLWALLLSLLLGAEIERMQAATWQLSTGANIRNAPGGEIVQVWDKGMRFTTRARSGNWLLISGYFPDDKWAAAGQGWWIHQSTARDISPAPAIAREAGVERSIIIDKAHFTLNVIETRGNERTVIFSTRVGLGIDDCFPAEQGGRCYYTEPGEYRVEFKVYHPEGIEWCIPAHMEQEARYREYVAKGERCFRGSLGKYALNIGKSYAIHGTSNPKSIGQRSSHGCVRVKNADAEYLHRLMREGDKVLIVE
jgi:lipoprotein-anchoring transpeptidase ErfK/SrfK